MMLSDSGLLFLGHPVEKLSPGQKMLNTSFSTCPVKNGVAYTLLYRTSRWTCWFKRRLKSDYYQVLFQVHE